MEEEEKEIATVNKSDGRIKEMLLKEFDIKEKKKSQVTLFKNIFEIPKDYVGLYNYIREESLTAITLRVIVDGVVLIGVSLKGVKASGTIVECNEIPDEMVDSVMSAYIKSSPPILSGEFQILINEKKELVLCPTGGGKTELLIDPVEFDVD